MLLPLIYAIQPVQVSTNRGIQIEYPKYDYIKINSDHRFHAHVINETNTLTNKTTSCILHLYNSSGYDINLSKQLMEFEDYNGVDFAFTVAGGNFSKIDYMTWVIQCNSTNEVGFASGNFLVTGTGHELNTDIFKTFIFILFIFNVLLLFYMLFLAIFKMVTVTITVYDVLLTWSSYILLLIVNYLGKTYMFDRFIENITDQLIKLTPWTNIVFPLLAFIIVFFIRSTQKKKPLTPQEIGGFRYG